MDDIKRVLVGEIIINASLALVWQLWTEPEHIAKWNNTSDDWHTPRAENDLRVGGKLFLRMETKDGSMGFDYECIYDEVIINEKISHTNADKRTTTVLFIETTKGVKLTETFEPENETPLDVQQHFCQSILDNFKDYVETHSQVWCQ